MQEELQATLLPTPLVPGADTLYPREVSEIYAKRIPNRTVVPMEADAAQAVNIFCEHAVGW